MEWKRCSKCGDLKKINNFWMQGDKRRSACIDCLTKQVDKKQKKEYDKKRYLDKKKNMKRKDEPICFRCQKKFANVKNNEIYWCFDCLLKYEKEYKRKISVEIIDIRRRKYISFFKKKKEEQKEDKIIEKTSLLSEKSFEEVFLQFIDKIENEDYIDERLRYKVLHASSLWNKEEVIEDMINKIKTFKDYDEEKINFPYKYYLQILIDKKEKK